MSTRVQIINLAPKYSLYGIMDWKNNNKKTSYNLSILLTSFHIGLRNKTTKQ